MSDSDGMLPNAGVTMKEDMKVTARGVGATSNAQTEVLLRHKDAVAVMAN